MTNFIAIFIISFFLNFLLCKFPIPNLKRTIPYTGGIAIFIAFSIFQINNMYYPFYLAIFLLGLIDDWVVLKWKQKLNAQLILCIGLVFNGFGLQWVDCIWLDKAISIIWLVGFINAFNLLDNMDGLCGGVVMIILGLMILLTNMEMLVLIAAIGGFMIWNLQGRIWMGDSGSLFLGLFMAINIGQMGNSLEWYQCLLLMGMPLLDTTFVTIERLMQGRRPWHGGKDHLSHQLVRLGLSDKGAVGVLWLATLLTGGMAVWL